MTSSHVDFLIAGQGLAGSLLAWQLLNKGRQVLVVDPCADSTSSRIAAGLIHPVTGRRIVKTWRAEEFIPFAIKTYREIEDHLGETFFEEYPVFEIFHDIKHRNDWLGRSADEGMVGYYGGECGPDSAPEGVIAPYGGCWILKGGWLNTPRFLDALRNQLKHRHSFLQDQINSKEITFTEKGIDWKNIHASTFIDCTGYTFMKSRHEVQALFNPCKGELLKIRMKGFPSDIVIHGNINLIPLGGWTYLAGSTYDFNNLDCERTPSAMNKLKEAITKMASPAFEILEHHAAIRPSTADRRPLIGTVPGTPGHYVFNGLGSKGVMLAPWMAAHLAKHLVGDSPLDREFSLLR